MATTNPDLDLIVNRVQEFFTAQIPTLSNSEVEYVLLDLLIWFDDLLERVRENSGMPLERNPKVMP